MSASPSPLRPSALAMLVTTLASGAFCTAAVAAAPSSVQVPLAWFAGSGALLLSVAAFAVTWLAQTARVLRRRIGDGEARIARLTSETAARTAELDRLTGIHADELARRASAHAAELGAANAAHAATRERLGEELRRAESGRAAAMAAAANTAGRMQALATGMLADLREMEHRHADEDVLGDLLHLDHRTAQAGRMADSIAVLTGARSGRRWAKPIVMESILRGAMGRIGAYQRVRLHSTSDAAVAGHAAEGVMHALAELLDNAANFSPPTAEVHVYVEEVPAGIVITVEDSGLVMSDVQLRRAERAVTAESLDLAGLSGTRLGLAVVGRLARKHGLTVSFRPSARGGTGALMLLPHDLLSRTPSDPPVAPLPIDLPPAAGPASAEGRAPARTTADAAEPEAAHGTPADPVGPAAVAARGVESRGEDGPGARPGGEEPATGPGGLPQRRRGRTLAAAHPEGPDAAPRTAPPPGGASRSAARFGSFRQAVRAAAAPTQPSNPPHPEGETEK
ncbi:MULTISPECIES: sensor histidine kinase KdpD [unclassified Streptomyces]|uniref:sensor histidine kinase n=1 Tax=unclassified Streptomyces TaxID=2593676 RepID=UPI00225280A2|nr:MULTISPECIES: ATP-binding protein [unclassified Streptomyces]MCX4524223.1 ATP-binding protein [Streptomyces sp. NBC_01551]MCX4545257.1 ATP-binding protein [Streptomyces sp. NBC_01565]